MRWEGGKGDVRGQKEGIGKILGVLNEKLKITGSRRPNTNISGIKIPGPSRGKKRTTLQGGNENFYSVRWTHNETNEKFSEKCIVVENKGVNE